MLTQARLKEALHYDPFTGIFIWKSSGTGKKIGISAGTKKEGYIQIKIKGKSYYAHQLAWLYMTGYLPIYPKNEIDHDDRNGQNNIWNNLQLLTKSDNQRNCKKPKNNTSNIVGVNWNNKFQYWCARINVNTKRIYLLNTIDFFEACCARKSAEIKYNYHPNHGK